MFLSDAMAVCRTILALDPLSFDGGLELSDAAVVVFLLCVGESVVYATAAANVVAPFSSQGKGRFKLCKEFLDLVVMVGGGFGDMDEIP